MACYGPNPKQLSYLYYLDLDRYYKKLSYYNNETAPDHFVLPDTKYVNDVSKWPEICMEIFVSSCLCIYTRANASI